MANFVMVLNDGETYTDLAGCKIVVIPDNIHSEDIEDYLKYPAKVAVTFDVWGGMPELETYSEVFVNGKVVGSGN